MTYIDYLDEFYRIDSINTIPSKAQLLYIKILMKFNRAGWPNVIRCSNLDLMSCSCIKNEKEFIYNRNYLVKIGFIGYKKGTKSVPNEYWLLDTSEISIIEDVPYSYVSDSRKGRASKNYSAWRDAVLDRDNYTCKICGKTNIELNVHHIRSWSRYKNLRFDVNNGITLCEDCHKKVHKDKVIL